MTAIKYTFKADDIKDFARAQHIATRMEAGRLHFRTCPYCGLDGETFSMDMKTGQFHCGHCGAHGTMVTLHKDFGFSLGPDVDAYYDSAAEYRYIHRKERAQSTEAAVRAMESIGISEAVTRRYGVTTQVKHDDILVFPFEDENGILRFVKYLRLGDSREAAERDCMPILFGMAQCNPQNSTLILAEGQMDVLSIAEAGYSNAVSVPMGRTKFTWVPHCWDFLQRFETLIVFGTYERGEISLLSEMEQRFQGTVKHVRPEDYQDCRTASELLQKHGKEAVKAAIEQAVQPKVMELISLDEVKRVDLNCMESISSTLPTLDKMLGGFFFGQLILLTGLKGDGKSTLASQFATAALAQSQSVFFYSGELMDWYFKAWIDLQCAGPDNLNGYRNPFGDEVYSVDANAQARIERWYKQRFFLYRNEVMRQESHRGLLEVMEAAIKQYGCRVLFLDNLMTALTDDLSYDQYRQQTIFVKKLAAMAKQYNVIIFLIAHPRKSNGFEFGNDDVAGSSNITNLVDVTLRYTRPFEEDDPDQPARVLQVLKNRLNGRTHRQREGIKLYYNEASKRISEKMNFSWTLGWEGFTRAGEDDDFEIELPF
jgi:archaellum biogenesis ATPase FlaH